MQLFLCIDLFMKMHSSFKNNSFKLIDKKNGWIVVIGSINNVLSCFYIIFNYYCFFFKLYFVKLLLDRRKLYELS